jgi:hypothetical protein
MLTHVSSPSLPPPPPHTHTHTLRYLRYKGCAYPGPLTWFYLFYIISLFVLFEQFKQRTYTKKDDKKTK